MVNLPLNTYASYTLTENEFKIRKSFIEDGISMYEQGNLDEAIYSFTQALLIDPHNAIAQKYLKEINQHKGLNIQKKINLLKLEDLYSNIATLRSRIDYFENIRNMIGRRLVSKGYSSEALAHDMVDIKNDAIKTYKDSNTPIQIGYDNNNPLDVINSALQYEKEELALKSYYLSKQYETMRKLDPSTDDSKPGSEKFLQSKYKHFKHTNRFYTPNGERIVHQNRYDQDINMASLADQPDNVHQLKRHLALIRREMNVLQNSITEKESKITRLTEQLVDSSLKVTEKTNRLETVSKNLNWQNDKIVDLSSRLDLSQRIIDEKNQEVQSLQNTFDNLKTDTITFENNLKKLISAKDQKFAKAADALNKFEEKIVALSNQYQLSEQTIAGLNDKLALLKEKLINSETSNESKQTKIDEFEIEMAQIETRLKKTSDNLSSATKGLIAKESQMKDLQSELSALEIRIKNDKQINALTIGKLKDEILSLLNKLKENENELKLSQADFQKLQIRYDKQSHKMDSKEEEIQKISLELKNIKNLAKKLGHEKKTIQAEITKQNKELAIANSKLVKKTKDFNDEREANKLKESTIVILLKEKKQFVQSISHLEKDLDAKTHEIDAIHDDLFTKITALNKSKSEKDNMAILLKKYEKDLSQAVKSSDIFQEQLQEKTASLEKVKSDLVEKDTIIGKDKIELVALKNDLSKVQISLDKEIQEKEKLLDQYNILKSEIEKKNELVHKQDREIIALQKSFEKAQEDIQGFNKHKKSVADVKVHPDVLTAKDHKIASLVKDLNTLESMFNSTKLTVAKQKKEIAVLKKTFENNYQTSAIAKASDNLQPIKSNSAYNVGSIINDLVSLNSEIIKLQGTYTNKTQPTSTNLHLKSIISVLSQAKRITQIIEDRANQYIMTQGAKANELKGILDIYKDKLNSTNESLKNSEVTVSILKEQIAFTQKQLFEKDKLLNKTQNDLLTLEEELSSVKKQIDVLKNTSSN